MECKLLLTPEITAPTAIQGDHQAIEIKDRKEYPPVLEAINK